jgi:hypothetical protein
VLLTLMFPVDDVAMFASALQELSAGSVEMLPAD